MSLHRAGQILAALAAVAYVIVLAFFIREIQGPSLSWLISQPLAHNIFFESGRIAIALVGIGGGLVFFLYYLVIAVKNALRRTKRGDEAPPYTPWLGIAVACILFLAGTEALRLH
jgi:formate-dependent nitrite reductase membrane component NrfD